MPLITERISKCCNEREKSSILQLLRFFANRKFCSCVKTWTYSAQSNVQERKSPFHRAFYVQLMSYNTVSDIQMT